VGDSTGTRRPGGPHGRDGRASVAATVGDVDVARIDGGRGRARNPCMGGGRRSAGGRRARSHAIRDYAHGQMVRGQRRRSRGRRAREKQTRRRGSGAGPHQVRRRHHQSCRGRRRARNRGIRRRSHATAGRRRWTISGRGRCRWKTGRGISVVATPRSDNDNKSSAMLPGGKMVQRISAKPLLPP